MNKIIGFIVLAVLIVGAVWYFGFNQPVQAPQETATQTPAATSPTATEATPSTQPKTPSSGTNPTGANAISVSAQQPGAVAIIDFVRLAAPGFVVIHENTNGVAGKILAWSQLLPKGESRNVVINVSLSPAGVYIAMLHADDGSKQFAVNQDPAVKDASGNIVMASFTANKTISSAPVVHVVSLKNLAFTPSTLTVKRGDQVDFINNDNTIHTVTAAAFGGQHILSLGASYTLDTKNLVAGTYSYKCDYHSMMKGTLIIQ